MDFAAGVYLPKAQNPIPPITHCIHGVYMKLFNQGNGGGERVESERRLEEQHVTKLG